MFTFLNPYMLWIKLAAFALVFAAGAYSGHRWQAGVIANLKLEHETAVTDTVRDALAKQRAVFTANHATELAAARAQRQIEIRTATTIKEIPTYVHDQIACPGGTYGLIRVLVAAERGISAADLDLPAGVTDDTCSPREASALAADLTAAFGDARANAQQLDDLVAAVRRNDAILAGTLVSPEP